MVRHLPVLETTGALRGDGSRRVIHPADVHGRFNTARKAIFYGLVAFLLSLPWLRMNGRPLVLLDIAERRFFLFGTAFNAQDTSLLFFVLMGMAWLLVFVTTLAGRVWCGWTCPQTVFLEGLFRPIERLIMGTAAKRLTIDASAMTASVVVRKTLLHIVWVVSAVLVSHAVLSLFVAPTKLAALIRQGPSSSVPTFIFALVTTVLVYFNFAWFREQTCLIVCPYGRLQSALVDEHSLTVGYDKVRGEPRGKVEHHVADAPPTEAKGDCVDCKRCVVVCPTGIDIRNGPQYDCIGCTACIDACDEVMDKLHRPRGLVRYDSLEGFAKKPTRILRSRVLFYAAMGLLVAMTGFVALRGRTEYVVNVLRIQGAPYTLEGDDVRNAFELHAVSKRAERTTLLIEPVAQNGIRLVVPLTRITLEPFADRRLPVFVISSRAHSTGDYTTQILVRREGAAASENQLLSLPCLAPGP